MSRGIKKFLYGIFYLAFFSSIGYFVYHKMTVVPPTCDDAIQNQDETGIDCGGSCIACDIKDLSAIVGGKGEVFVAPDNKVYGIVEVINPNATHHATSFDYTVDVRDRYGDSIESVPGVDSLYAGERHYLYITGIQTPYKDIASLSLSATGTMWRSAEEVQPPKLDLLSLETQVSSSTVRVTGKVKNSASFSANGVRVVAVLKNSMGEDVFASQTILTSVAPFETQDFTVSFPSDTTLAEGLDPKGTRVFVSSK